MSGPRKFPTVKRALFKIHKDLEKITSPSDWWNADDLSDLETIILLLEDRRFFQHSGIDYRSVIRELSRMITLRRFGGASTIDMQFVRTRTGYKSRTLNRKLYEMALAYLLQFRMSKIAILRSYLQEMYLGSGIYGVSSAAWTVFGKGLYELSREESAVIAAMMVYPRPLAPNQSWRHKVDRRAAYGLRLFSKYGSGYKQRFE